MRGMDAYVASAIGTLQAQLPAKLAALNVEAGAPTLTDPVAYWPGGQDPIPEKPAVEVSMADLDGEAVDVNAAHVTTRIPVYAVLWHEYAQGHGDDREQINRRTWRYARALTEVLYQHEAIGEGTWPVSFQQRCQARIDPEAGRDVPVFIAFALVVVRYSTVDPVIG